MEGLGLPSFSAERTAKGPISGSREKWEAAYDRYGAKFGVKDGDRMLSRNLPFDAEPRILQAKEFEKLADGLVQRVNALNAFLADIYSDCRIVKDGAISPEFVFSSDGFLPCCIGVAPKKGIYAHIAGIDLVEDGEGNWYVLEDNLRVPSGVSYPLTARLALSDIGVPVYGAEDTLSYGEMLKSAFEYVSCGGINAVLTPGENNCAFYEHAFLAEQTGSALCRGSDLFADGGAIYFKGASGIERVGCLYSRLDGNFADPLFFRSDSGIGVAGLFSAYASGNIAVVNAFGCGAADDKGIYRFVPKFIEYYLGEKPILPNVPTFLPSESGDMKFIEENLKSLVIKEVSESGGSGVVFASRLGREELAVWKERLRREPRRFIAQKEIDLRRLKVGGGKRRADFRAFVVSGERTAVLKGGLTRFGKNESALLVNSSQGGGFKDTWVLSQ